ncbi:MAG: hypothetical protein ACHQ50_06725 [Fimbriimonadales bacterium]
MKVLLDECVDPALAVHFARHEEVGVVAAGLTSIANGELLRAATSLFDAFITVDKGIVYQQNLASFDLIFVLLRVGSNRADALAPHVGRIESILDSAERGRFYIIEP